MSIAGNLYTHQDVNVRKTWALMTGAFVLLIGLGWILSQTYGDPTILYLFAAFSIVGNFVAYWKSDRIALAMSGAQPVTREESVRLYRIVENLCITAGLPLPRLHVIEAAQINAFATGRDPKHAAIAVTRGALEQLDDNELAGVLAHELSHVGNRDILVSTVVVVMAGIIAIVSDWFLRSLAFGGNRDRNNGGVVMLALGIAAAILAPLAATLIRMAVSRKREFLADASGALLTRYPEGLASALEKIARDQAPLPHAHTATAHLFLSSPFKGKSARNWMTHLFMTHPPLEDRIRILRGMPH
ncbi:MAG TPA: M48 family metallopeptidase [Candidatus Paceibacterota bacterium]|nr:M48 family metallopeptidase [Candidatus Paceibacterota bacterium]